MDAVSARSSARTTTGGEKLHYSWPLRGSFEGGPFGMGVSTPRGIFAIYVRPGHLLWTFAQLGILTIEMINFIDFDDC